DVAAGDRILDGGDDGVADAGVATSRAAEHTNAKDLLGARVVGDLESRLLLDHSIYSCRRAGSRAGRAWPNGWLSSLRSAMRAERGSLGLFEDLDDPPTLGGGQRPGLHDRHEVAHAYGVGLVVRLDLGGASHDLA